MMVVFSESTGRSKEGFLTQIRIGGFRESMIVLCVDLTGLRGAYIWLTVISGCVCESVCK